MLNVALLSALSYFICYAGNWMFGQSMSDRPIFIGAVTGLLLGDLQQGLIIGATLSSAYVRVRQNMNRMDKINFRCFIYDFAIMGERY